MDGIYFLSILTLFANIVTVIVGLVLLFGNVRVIGKVGVIRVFREKLQNILEKHVLQIVLLISVIATSGSLYFSEYLGFTPCKLCWYQRIFMYPQVVLILIAYIKKTNDVFKYILALSIIGLLIAGYHYFLQTFPNPYAPCGDVGYSVSCTVDFFKYFGYITIPWMSFSAFVIIFSVSLLMFKNKDTST